MIMIVIAVIKMIITIIMILKVSAAEPYRKRFRPKVCHATLYYRAINHGVGYQVSFSVVTGWIIIKHFIALSSAKNLMATVDALTVALTIIYIRRGAHNIKTYIYMYMYGLLLQRVA